MTKQWSIFQKKIFLDATDKGKGHTIVEARAGSGKTSTLIESLKYIPKGKRVIALAFNKNIQKELSERAPSRVSCFTFHSLGLQGIKQRFGMVEIDDNKVFNIVKDLIDSRDEYDLISNICDTVAFCKYSLRDTPSGIEDIILEFGIDVCGLEQKEFIKLVIQTLTKDKAQINKVDFNDMCWMPFVYDIPLGTYDYVYVDEYQDLNKSQLIMAKKVCSSNGGRMMVFGDEKQDLYSWRSSDASLVRELKNEPNAKVLELPISYRCPKKVIELVKPYVKNITCPDTAKEGEINEISVNEMYKLANGGCFILSRTNAPLIKICLNFIRNGKKCNIKGRDIGKNLTSLIKKSKKKQIPAFLKWLNNWKEEEAAKLIAKGIKTDNLVDRCECLESFCEDLGSLEEVKEKIEELFNDTEEKNIIMCSSIHKSKGLERDEVFLIHWTFRKWFNDVEDLEEDFNDEELNIAYVASTRTKDKLYLVDKF